MATELCGLSLTNVILSKHKGRGGGDNFFPLLIGRPFLQPNSATANGVCGLAQHYRCG